MIGTHDTLENKNIIKFHVGSGDNIAILFILEVLLCISTIFHVGNILCCV